MRRIGCPRWYVHSAPSKWTKYTKFAIFRETRKLYSTIGSTIERCRAMTKCSSKMPSMILERASACSTRLLVGLSQVAVISSRTTYSAASCRPLACRFSSNSPNSNNSTPLLLTATFRPSHFPITILNPSQKSSPKSKSKFHIHVIMQTN